MNLGFALKNLHITKSTTALPADAPAGGTGAAAGGWDTAPHRDAAIVTINTLKTIVGELQTKVNSIIDAMNL